MKYSIRNFGMIRNAAMIALLLFSIGCSRPAEPAKKPSATAAPLGSLSETQAAQRLLAIDAKGKLFASLLGELTQSMGEKGPAKSISVCKTRAPEIAKTISEETGVRIGRTSFKLRNENNTSPAWADPFVGQQVETEVAVELPGNALGVLIPIRMIATCTLCHGNDKQVMPEVKAAIVSSYPNDQAIGFAEGDIRGYFWVEVPDNP